MERTIQEAIQAIEAGDKRRAHSLLLGLIQEQPDNVLAWLWMAEVYSDPKNKKDCYIRALQIDPENEVALAHMKAIKYQEAMEKMDAESQADNVAETTTNVNYGRTGAGIETKPKKKAKPIVFVVLFLIIALAGAIAYIVLDKQGYFDRWFAIKTAQTNEPGQIQMTTEIPLLAKITDTPEPTIVSKEDTVLQTATFTITPTHLPTKTPTPKPTKINYEPTMPTPDPRNLVKNGYFLDGIEGWEQDFITDGGQGSREVIEYENSKYKKALYLHQERAGTIWFKQRIPVNTVDLDLSFNIQVDTNNSYSGNSGLFVIYTDENDYILGWTRFCNGFVDQMHGAIVVGNPRSLLNSSVSNNYHLDNKKVYKPVRINLKEEIESNLLGVDVEDIAAIWIAVYSSVDVNASWTWVYLSEVELLER